ncbi:hypothetical protein [Acetobacter aceti]|uniref:hypothetical protein n=1 Tax=Acetobacter aceti TaxID=435 RepID=UPI001E348A01|nr:hypothetical protein [Acetobacter aceti]
MIDVCHDRLINPVLVRGNSVEWRRSMSETSKPAVRAVLSSFIRHSWSAEDPRVDGIVDDKQRLLRCAQSFVDKMLHKITDRDRRRRRRILSSSEVRIRSKPTIVYDVRRSASAITAAADISFDVGTIPR